MSIYKDQSAFMLACDQTVGLFNPPQARLYAKLVDEEAWEVHAAQYKLWGQEASSFSPEEVEATVAELVDGAIDTIYVCLGLMNSLGVDFQKAWDEVHRSNMSKLCPDTGKAIKNIAGKVQKPPHFEPPNLAAVVAECWGTGPC